MSLLISRTVQALVLFNAFLAVGDESPMLSTLSKIERGKIFLSSNDRKLRCWCYWVSVLRDVSCICMYLLCLLLLDAFLFAFP